MFNLYLILIIFWKSFVNTKPDAAGLEFWVEVWTGQHLHRFKHTVFYSQKIPCYLNGGNITSSFRYWLSVIINEIYLDGFSRNSVLMQIIHSSLITMKCLNEINVLLCVYCVYIVCISCLENHSCRTDKYALDTCRQNNTVSTAIFKNMHHLLLF